MVQVENEGVGRVASSASAGSWSSTVSFGLVLVGLTLAVSSVHLLVVGTLRGRAVVVPLIGAVCLATGVVSLRGTRRTMVVALLVAGLVLLGNLRHLAVTLGLPASPWDFVPNLAAVVGLGLAILAAVASLRHREDAPAVQRRVRGMGLGIIAVGISASLALAATAPAALPPGAVVVETVDNEFSPSSVSVAAGGVVGVRNLDAYGHTFTVESLGIDVRVAGDGTGSVEIDPGTPPGTYQVTCVLHPGLMRATLTVTDGSG